MHYKDENNGLYWLDEGVSPAQVVGFPTNAVSITDDEADQIRATQQPVPTAAEVEATFTAAIQKRLDDFARTRNYDGILSACSYATSSVPKFQGEGAACVNLRDATWAAAYAILAEVQAGDRAMPQSLEDIEADLPALAWP
jgi:hypothetical protein